MENDEYLFKYCNDGQETVNCVKCCWTLAEVLGIKVH